MDYSVWEHLNLLQKYALRKSSWSVLVTAAAKAFFKTKLLQSLFLFVRHLHSLKGG